VSKQKRARKSKHKMKKLSSKRSEALHAKNELLEHALQVQELTLPSMYGMPAARLDLVRHAADLQQKLDTIDQVHKIQVLALEEKYSKALKKMAKIQTQLLAEQQGKQTEKQAHEKIILELKQGVQLEQQNFQQQFANAQQQHSKQIQQMEQHYTTLMQQKEEAHQMMIEKLVKEEQRQSKQARDALDKQIADVKANFALLIQETRNASELTIAKAQASHAEQLLEHVTKFEKQIALLKGEIASWEQKFSNADLQLHEKEMECSNWETKCTEVMNKLKNAEQMYALQVAETIASATESEVALKHTLQQELETERKMWSIERTELEQNKSKLIQQYQDEISLAKAELSTKNSELESKCKQQEQVVERLHLEIAKYREICESTTAQWKRELQLLNDSVSSSSKTHEQQVEQLKDAHAQEQNQLKQYYQVETNNLKDLCAATERKYREEVEKIRGMMEIMQKGYSQQQREVEVLRKETQQTVQQASNQVVELQNKIAEQMTRESLSQQQQEALSLKNAELSEQVQKLQDEIAQQAVKMRENDGRAFQNTVIMLQNQIGQEHANSQQLQSTIATLQLELHHKNDEIASLMHDEQPLRIQISALSRELQECKQAYDMQNKKHLQEHQQWEHARIAYEHKMRINVQEFQILKEQYAHELLGHCKQSIANTLEQVMVTPDEQFHHHQQTTQSSQQETQPQQNF
jgi:hypothetical protein